MRSYIPDFELVNAHDLDSALSLLARGEGWRAMAGGTDLMVLLNAGKLPWTRLVSIRDIPELRAIDVSADEVTIGAAVTYSQIRQNAALQRHFVSLCAAASWTGGIANQNRGTLGGNIANASPAADSGPALLAYDAILELASLRGIRRVAYRDFHTGYKCMQLSNDELIARVRLPLMGADWREYSRKVGTRRAQAIAKVCLTARAKLSDGKVQAVRIALGSVAPVPLRCRATEQILTGERMSAQLISQAREALRNEIAPITDIRSTASYRAQVAENLLAEFLEMLQ